MNQKNAAFDSIYQLMRDAKSMLDQSPEGSIEQAFYRGRFHAFAAALDCIQDSWPSGIIGGNI